MGMEGGSRVVEEPNDEVSIRHLLAEVSEELAARKTCSKREQEALEMRMRAVQMCLKRQW